MRACANACNVVLVPGGQTDQDYRMTVNYQLLNARLKRDAFPLPDVRGILDRVASFPWYSQLDLKAGFHAIPVSACSEPLLAFCTPDGHWTWTRMPIGLATAPNHFQAAMNSILDGVLLKWCVVYLDDVTVFANSWEECWQWTQDIIQILGNAGITLSARKCIFCT